MAKKPKKSLQKGASPTKEVDVGRGRVSNTVERLKGVTAGKQKRNAVIALSIIMAAVLILPPTIMYILGGSPFKPQLEEGATYIGFYTVEVNTIDEDGNTTQIDAKFALVDYNTEEDLETVIDGDGETVYRTTDVTMAFLVWVDSSYTFPNETILLQASASESTPYNNQIFIYRNGEQSDFNADIIYIDGTYGSGLSPSIIASENFTIGFGFVNDNPRFYYGEVYYIPTPFRYNETVSVGGLWLEIDAKVDQCFIGPSLDELTPAYWLYYDGTNSYMVFNFVEGNEDGICSWYMSFECDSSPPNQFRFIQGQWDGEVLATLV